MQTRLRALLEPAIRERIERRKTDATEITWNYLQEINDSLGYIVAKAAQTGHGSQIGFRFLSFFPVQLL